MVPLVASGSSDREPSIALHRSAEFVEAGRPVGVGDKYGERRDLLDPQHQFSPRARHRDGPSARDVQREGFQCASTRGGQRA